MVFGCGVGVCAREGAGTDLYESAGGMAQSKFRKRAYGVANDREFVREASIGVIVSQLTGISHV